MSSIWRINGETTVALGIKSYRLTGLSLAADTFVWDDPLAAFDANLRWAYGDEIVVTVDDVVRFRGTVDDTPRDLGAASESITYTATGPWQALEEMPYVQFYSVAEDPDAATPVLIGKEQGLVVLGQADDGQKVDLGVAITAVLQSAIDAGWEGAIGAVTGFDFKILWQEVTDLSHASVIKRMLQLAPDAVSWCDYSVNPPALNISRASLLGAVTVKVPAKDQGNTGDYTPFEQIKLRPCYEQLSAGVVLYYLRTNANGWRTVDIERYPLDTPSRGRRVSSFTIQLGAANYDSTRIRQEVDTRFINTNLVFVGYLKTGMDHYDEVAAFWKRKLPLLKYADAVEILGFRNGTRQLPEPVLVDDGLGGTVESLAIDPACERELEKGAVTGWMQQVYNIKAEYQKIAVECLYKIATVDGKQEVKHQTLSVIITATSAQTKTYSLLTDESGNDEEPKPVALAQQLYTPLAVLQHEGSFPIVRTLTSFAIWPGKVVNFDCAARPEWATMRACVQSISLDQTNRELVTVRPARLSSFGDLIDLWRANRKTQSTGLAFARTGGQIGSEAALTLFSPRNDVSTTDLPAIQGTSDTFAPAGAVATKEELVARVVSYYKGLNIMPRGGDCINIPVTGRGWFRSYVHAANPAGSTTYDNGFIISFVTDGDFPISAVTYWITMHQLGIY
ncbi:MAG: hypothetical protein WC205_16985 [Opitutaceae bacterium]|jgi:hypothetical protein